MFYKIVQNNKVIDVVKNPHFVTFLSTGHIAFTDKSSANGIVGSDEHTVYSFIQNKRADIAPVSIEEISLEEFNRLQNLLNSGEIVTADTIALEEAKHSMIEQLSTICKNKITAGFSIILSDGELYDFRLTTEDQLNLMMIETQISSGDKTFIYHATNQPCKVFARDDMIKIVEAFKRHTLYHTTYFNAAKHYIGSLVNIDEVNSFTYGKDLSNTVTNLTLRRVLKNGGRK
jgi:hypothetical protein